MPTLYNVRLKGDDFIINKFDRDMELQATYKVTIGPRGNLSCDCPQAINRNAECRHLRMLNHHFLPHFHIGDGYLFCYETSEWTEPPL